MTPQPNAPPGKAGNGVEHEVGNQSPERQTNHQPLRQGHAFVVLTQDHPHHDVAKRGQRTKLGHQEQEAGNYPRINDQSSTLSR